MSRLLFIREGKSKSLHCYSVSSPHVSYLPKMNGWVGRVGTIWDLKHVGVTPDLDAILAQDREGLFFLLKIGRHFSFPHPPTLDTLCGPYSVWGSCRDVIHTPVPGGMLSASKMTFQAGPCVFYHEAGPCFLPRLMPSVIIS